MWRLGVSARKCSHRIGRRILFRRYRSNKCSHWFWLRECPAGISKRTQSNPLRMTLKGSMQLPPDRASALVVEMAEWDCVGPAQNPHLEGTSLAHDATAQRVAGALREKVDIRE